MAHAMGCSPADSCMMPGTNLYGTTAGVPQSYVYLGRGRPSARRLNGSCCSHVSKYVSARVVL